MQPSERAKQPNSDWIASHEAMPHPRSAGIVTAASRNQSSEVGSRTPANSSKSAAAELPLAISQMVIDHASPQPIYKQICQMFRAAISTGDLPPGLLLPTTHEMAAALKVTRNTVVTAYSRLVAEGYLVSNTRRGTRVAESAASRAAAPMRRMQSDIELAPQQKIEFPIEVSFRARRLLEFDPTQTFAAEVQMPDPSLYPRVRLGRLLSGEFYRAPNAESDSGVRQFQTAVTTLLRHYRGVQCEPEQVIPVQSLENALDLTCRALIDPGHCAYVENPTDPSVRECLRAGGAQVIPIPSDEQGADVAQILGPPPRLIYVTPSVGFPLGQQMSESRRLAVLEAAYRSSAIVFECDRCSELLYAGRRLGALQSYSREGRVLYFGSLHEALGPHIRAAYLVVPPSLVDDFARLSRQLDYGPEPFVLGALGKFLEDVGFAVHLKELRTEYAKRLSMLSDAARRYLSEAVLFEPAGGLTLALRFPEKIDEAAVCGRAGPLNIAIAPLSRFYQAMHDGGPNGIVLGFGTIPERMIESVVRRLADIVTDVRSAA